MRRLLVLLMVLLPGARLGAQEEPAPAEKTEEKQENPFQAFEKLTKDATLHGGFFDLYEKDGKVYLAVPRERLGQDFLMEYKIARGIGARGLFGGTMLNLFEGNVMALEKRGDKVFLLQRPHRFRAGSDPAAARAVDLTFGSSVVESAKVEATRPDSALVLEVTSWFLSDLSGIGQRMRFALGERGRPGNAQLDASRSYLESVKSFPDNVNVRANLTFKPGEPTGLPSVPDGRYVPVAIHYTMARLPQAPMEIRHGDERVGNFWTVHKDFSQEDSIPFVRMVNRWRLEPGERAGSRVRPRKPITYYIDHTVPDEYRAAFKEGVEAWNEAFREAGFEGAIRALDLPPDADAEDIRYATLRWNTSDQAGYGAIGPSTVDPRTGEILDADILFESNMFMGFRNTWRNLVSPITAAEAFEMALGVGAFEVLDPQSPGVELPGFASAMSAQGILAGAVLAARGELAPGEPMPADVLNQFTKWVVMHEVGHSLGLQHNFRSSASTAFDDLYDADWARRNGVFSSVMEYPVINVAPKGKKNGFYYNPGVGSYDRWAIGYAYSPDARRAAELARQAADPRHMFGNEAGGPGALDPSINVYDLSADPLTWGAERTALIRELFAELPSYALRDDGSYAELTQAFQGLTGMYAQALAPAVKYIGGQYLNRDHKGDPRGRLPFENVPLADQERAFDLIVERVFAEEAFQFPESLLTQLGSNRWGHWGSTTSFNGRIDYPLHERVLGLQSSVLGQLLHPWRLARIRDAETKYGPDAVLSIPEVMGGITEAVWSEVWDGQSRNVAAARRDLQRAYLDQMTEILLDPPERMPADARSVARLELLNLGEAISSALEGELDTYTAAHLLESEARITMALDAGLQVGPGGNGG